MKPGSLHPQIPPPCPLSHTASRLEPCTLRQGFCLQLLKNAFRKSLSEHTPSLSVTRTHPHAKSNSARLHEQLPRLTLYTCRAPITAWIKPFSHPTPLQMCITDRKTCPFMLHVLPSQDVLLRGAADPSAGWIPLALGQANPPSSKHIPKREGFGTSISCKRHRFITGSVTGRDQNPNPPQLRSSTGSDNPCAVADGCGGNQPG